MKAAVVLALACVICTVPLAVAETLPPSFAVVDVPAGEMIDAVESLAQQCGVDVMYPSGLLKGRMTRGLRGTFEPRVAFRKLLQDTPLVVSEDGGALLITQAVRTAEQATALHIAKGLPQVRIEGWRETAGADSWSGGALQTAAPVPAQWERRQLWVDCDECNFRGEMRFILQRLGARDLHLRDRVATFSALVPAGRGEGNAGDSRNVFARWERVTFHRAGSPYALNDGIVLYGAMKDRVLPLFTTRNFKEESGGRLSVEVLLPVSPDPRPQSSN